MPYTYGVLMASHTYWTTVFMSRAPLMQFTGRHGEGEMQVQALEALMDYQVQVGGMLVPMYIWLLDVGKYGSGVVGHYWTDEVRQVSEIVEQEEMFMGVIATGKTKKAKQTRQVPGYSGNKLFNIRPQDFIPDPRVPFSRFQEGEFAGRYFELGWNQVIRRKQQGFYTNIDALITKGAGAGNQFDTDRDMGSDQIDIPNNNEDIFGRDIHSKNTADILKGYELAVELVPKDWGLGKSDFPEKWMFTLTADFEVVIGAQPLGALHGEFPYDIMELEPEGYGLANRGIPEILDPVQRTMDWLINSHFYNVRKTLNNQFIADPSRLVMKDILEPQAGGVIRAKPAAYGTDVRNAIHQLQVHDVTRNNLADINIMNEVGQRTFGVNDQILGMLGPSGGRRSATEVRTSSTFGTNRLKTNAEYFSAMGWIPMASKMLQNTQQFYDANKKFRIVGDMATQAGPGFMDVTPETIAGFYDLVPIDGTLPVDRFAQANLWRELMGQLRNFPEISQEYDMSKIFSWVAQLAGMKNINQFKVQMVADDVALREAEKGNLVPVGEGGPGGDLEAIPTGQLSGVGPTA